MQKKYSVIVEVPIESAMHHDFQVEKFGDYGKNLTIIKNRVHHICNLKTYITEASGEIQALDTIDVLCLALSITQSGVFSRIHGQHGGGRHRIKWLSNSPPTFPGTGISVQDVKGFDYSLLAAAEKIFRKFTILRDQKPDVYTILVGYTVSCRFFNDEMIRESAINFFSVVEMIATIVLPRRIAQKSTYSLRDLYELAKTLKATTPLLEEAYKLRGELAHGHPKHLLLMQHSLNEHPLSSWSLKIPALKCKELADDLIVKFLDYEK